MKRPSPTPRPTPVDPQKESRLRRWAAKIAAELPSGTDDALAVLKHAEDLIRWADRDEAPSTMSTRRAAR